MKIKVNEELSKEFAVNENKRTERLRKFLYHNIHRTIKFTVDFRPIAPKRTITVKAGNWKLKQNDFGCWYMSTTAYSGVLSGLSDVCIMFD